RAVLSYTGDDRDVHEYLEASSLEEDESVLLVDLIAPSSSFGAPVDALGVVELDGDAVFSEEPSLPDRSPDDGTATPPEDEGPNRRRPRLPTDDAAEEPTEEPTEEAEPEDAVDGNTFTSPNFGFSISWDEDVWEVTATATDPDFDQLVLDTRDSSLSLSGTTDFDGDVGECLEGVTAFLSAGTEALEIDDIDVLDDEDGDPIEGEERDRAFVANEYTGTFEGDDAQFVYYVECRTLVPEESVLVVIHFVLDPEDYPDEAEAREEILDRLETEGSNGGRDDERTPTPEDDEATATPEEDDDPTATPEDAETPPPGDRATFESDAYPFTLSWDPDIWEETASDDAGVVLTDGPSSLTITAVEDYEGDSVACVQGQVDEIGGVEGVTSVEAETGENGRRVSGGNSERFYALYRVTASDGTFGGTNDILVYLECRALVENDSVLTITHIVFNPDQYEEEAERREDVLGSIEIEG
ncbi:MAG TPA: hypothetical protein VGR16_13105, partial [Thermomicrobiales bacterium]|nr:hypothetical protein [Thermomicrobiales bacterium]